MSASQRSKGGEGVSQHVWGIDPAISHYSFAYADLHTEHVQVETMLTPTSKTDGARLAHIYDAIQADALQAARRFPPYVVWVEQPSGRFPKPQLAYAVGVVQAALSDALEVPVWTIPSGAWKKRTVGRGNASKAQVAVWVRAWGIGFDGQDEADAVCVAIAGRLMVQSGRWEQAA